MDALLIGRDGIEPYEAQVVAYLASLGLTQADQLAWRHAEASLDELNLVNGGTLFLEHIQEVAGKNALTRFDQISEWENSIWLPVAFTPPTVINPATDPIFLGSCQLLIEQLGTLRELSNVPFGDVPGGYAEMRTDIKAWYKSDFAIPDDQQILLWVWKALHDGASAAVKRGAPMWGMPS